jgi:hypothetical protein
MKTFAFTLSALVIVAAMTIEPVHSDAPTSTLWSATLTAISRTETAEAHSPTPRATTAPTDTPRPTETPKGHKHDTPTAIPSTPTPRPSTPIPPSATARPIVTSTPPSNVQSTATLTVPATSTTVPAPPTMPTVVQEAPSVAATVPSMPTRGETPSRLSVTPTAFVVVYQGTPYTITGLPKTGEKVGGDGR